jgi:Fusaric acid resistance protein-like
MAVIGVAFGEFDSVDYGWTAQAGYYLLGTAAVAVIAFAMWPVGRVRAGSNRMSPTATAPAHDVARTTVWTAAHAAGSPQTDRLFNTPAVRATSRSSSGGPWRSAAGAGLRLAWCVAIGTAVSCALHHDESHSFWIPLTVAVIFRPNTPVVARTVNRLAGTLVGGLVAVLVLLTIARHGWLVAACAAVSISFAVAATPKLYALKVVGVTCSALLSASVASVDPAFPAVRLIDTAIGAVIAIVFGHLLWPGGRRDGVARQVAELPSPGSAARTPGAKDPVPAEPINILSPGKGSTLEFDSRLLPSRAG